MPQEYSFDEILKAWRNSAMTQLELYVAWDQLRKLQALTLDGGLVTPREMERQSEPPKHQQPLSRDELNSLLRSSGTNL